MHSSGALSSLDTALLMAPCAILMILALFGMDERLTSVGRRDVRRHKFCEVDLDGRGLLSDPDGKSVAGDPTRKARKHPNPVRRASDPNWSNNHPLAGQNLLRASND